MEVEPPPHWYVPSVQKIGTLTIKLTKEVPSEHEDRKLPVLDLKTWIEEIQREREVTKFCMNST